MSVFADKLLDKVKLSLRESSNDFDDDIKADIDASALDLMQAGILSYFFDAFQPEWEVDPLILRAVKWYCLSVYGLYNTDMEKYAEAYASLKATLATQTKYRRNPDEKLRDAEIQEILSLISDLEKRVSYIEQTGTGGGGTNGKDGVGIKSIVQTTTSTDDNGKNIITVTLTDGNKSTFVVENGSQGSQGLQGQKGADGYTPVKGKDYFTIEDVQNIVNQVIATLPIEQEVNDSEKPVSSVAVKNEFVRFSNSYDQIIDEHKTEAVNEANTYTDEKVGDIETALDTIIAIQNSLIGGGN